MIIKGFTDTNTNIETPNDVGVTEKPLKSEQIISKRVDINVLKSRIQEKQSKETRQNLTVFAFFQYWNRNRSINYDSCFLIRNLFALKN